MLDPQFSRVTRVTTKATKETGQGDSADRITLLVSSSGVAVRRGYARYGHERQRYRSLSPPHRSRDDRGRGPPNQYQEGQYIQNAK